MVFWFTGLPCSGKTTLALSLVETLRAKNLKVEHLDGDVIRKFYPRLGFTKEARNIHIRQMTMLASILERNGIIVVASFISPYKETRAFARENCQRFYEVYLNTSLEACEKRDVKGMYEKARKGEIASFTGVDDVYEVPENPEITINTEGREIFDCIKEIITKSSLEFA